MRGGIDRGKGGMNKKNYARQENLPSLTFFNISNKREQCGKPQIRGIIIESRLFLYVFKHVWKGSLKVCKSHTFRLVILTIYSTEVTANLADIFLGNL